MGRESDTTITKTSKDCFSPLPAGSVCRRKTLKNNDLRPITRSCSEREISDILPTERVVRPLSRKIG